MIEILLLFLLYGFIGSIVYGTIHTACCMDGFPQPTYRQNIMLCVVCGPLYWAIILYEYLGYLDKKGS